MKKLIFVVVIALFATACITKGRARREKNEAVEKAVAETQAKLKSDCVAALNMVGETCRERIATLKGETVEAEEGTEELREACFARQKEIAAEK